MFVYISGLSRDNKLGGDNQTWMEAVCGVRMENFLFYSVQCDLGLSFKTIL